ncbi:hypothetical protein TST_0030 [Thermosulfidibacter takaii ABI70S6]|uniref:2Fe-2S ferredoxin-type domain-containing protein n=1 Tax=Thermosulfidibacter takaii (strain DSM 17441 / JCM 13301 / NBRC 103674 / ABI70S6) TaxID=1298851 RepID=A0A0S3QR76_THET7|nr:ASKHA domain-containing protein [Thermosulfidibacter takaii]BAT70840.1 hypothetical protein TST_0030 [Thermosulfidibacter takaii ABI70S6]
MPKVRILPDEVLIHVSKGDFLYPSLGQINFAFPCGGKGICGNCRVRFLNNIPEPTPTELEKLSPEEIKAGIRLACQCKILHDCTILIPKPKAKHIPEASMPDITLELQPITQIDKGFGAVDIGTSTVYVLINKGFEEKVVSFWNPQALWGDDVVTRLTHAMNPKAKEAMQLTLLREIEKIIDQEAPLGVDIISASGNPAMTAIAAKEDVSGLTRHPFSLGAKGYRYIPFKSSKQGIMFLPEIGSFLGSDALSMLAVSILTSRSKVFIAADIGTNTELFLKTENYIYGTSLPAGPVFEGFGITHGTPAVEGAIYEVHEDLSFSTIGNKREVGFCGSGIISALYALKKRGFLLPDGSLITGNKHPFGHVFLYQEDIRKIQLAKAAVFAGVKILLQKAGVSGESVEEVFIAGNFGRALKKEWLLELSFLPSLPKAQFHYLGNTSLWGAKWSILSKKCHKMLDDLKNEVTIIQLANEVDFQEVFMEGMKL